MNIRLFSLSVGLAGLVLAGAGGPALADDQRSLIMANTCYSCHGTDGHSVGAMPSIAGKSESFIINALRRFRNGDKPSTVMDRIAKGFTDAEIAALAKHFSSK